ncbi:MAG TPA: DHA2 family efflux MFS transporter permease subunit [Stellaceae bacterium]|nr:DHA2 family efflux MFS transporter permease subunit [Stellaceae bacterium]
MRSAGSAGETAASPGGEAPGPRVNRAAITASITCATIMQGVDTTIANVALPHIQGSFSCSQDQIAWVVTSYIVAAAIMTPLTGWLAGRLGIKWVFFISVVGFTLSSALCGVAASLTQLVLSRVLQGMCGAALVPLSQSVLLRTNPPERHGRAMAIWGIGTMLGPIIGPALGGWLTDNFTWRWVFLINLPVGILCALGIIVFIHDDRRAHLERFDFFGFGTLSVAVGAVQMMLDRGELKDWFGSTEIWVEASVAALCLYLFIVHTATTSGASFFNRSMLKDANFTAGIILMFFVGIILNGTMVLLPTMMQVLMNYPVVTAGFVMAPRGMGTLISMILVARIIGKVDTRLIIFCGLALTALSLWQMTGFSLTMDKDLLLVSGTLQGVGLGFVFTPLSVAAFSTLSRQHLTQGTAIFSLMRNIGGSVGVSIVEALFIENTQVIHSRLVEHVRPDSPLTQSALRAAPYSLSEVHGIAALNAEVTRQAQMIAYIDNFYLMAVIILMTLPLLLLLRRPRAVAKGPAVAMD